MTHSLAISSLTMALTGPVDVERRSDFRYPVEVALDYRVNENGIEASGSGKTINIGSGGILFECLEEIPSGIGIEVVIHWPAGRGRPEVLLFRARGRTVWSRGHQCAVEILKSGFSLLG